MKMIDERVRLSQLRHNAGDIRSLIMDKAVHRDHVVEPCRASDQACRRPQMSQSLSRAGFGRALARKVDERRRNVDADDIGAAFGEFERERACTAACVKNSGAAHDPPVAR